MLSPEFIAQLPKAELHLHIEGTLEPELMFALAQRNGIALPFASIAAVRAAYQFSDLQTFLTIYYQGARVLCTEQDFYDLTFAYMEKCQAQYIRHAEIFFDPQTHTDRGLEFATVINGISRALTTAHQRFAISTKLIMCFLRDHSVASAMVTLEQSLPFKEHIVAVGLDSAELNHPPQKFTEVFQQARTAGFQAVAHAGEEGPPAYIRAAIESLQVARIDHGVRCLEDADLVGYLKQTQLPLTICPLSNVALQVFRNMACHNVKKLDQAGLCVTINSDDPAYFGGYLNENLFAICAAFDFTEHDLCRFMRNAFMASFLTVAQKQVYLAELTEFMRAQKIHVPTTT